METVAAPPKISSSKPAQAPEVPFGVNEVRLNLRQWVTAGVILIVILWLTPRVWTRIQRFDTGPDYRIPYQLSKDYWLYERHLKQDDDHNKVVLLGDSVVWGEYVSPDGTLSHFLNREGGTNRFVNGGLNGLFPIAEEGLISFYGQPIRHQKVLLHCNMLWMSSPKADLSTPREAKFNHSHLVPQFHPRIPCYRANANERLSAVVERQLDFFGWVNHLQSAYFDQHSILSWTLEDDGNAPPNYPNAAKNPLAQITLRVPAALGSDPERGPGSPRHKAWNSEGQNTVAFEWVGLDSSLQWAAFQRLVTKLRERGNDVLVVLGPFNEHMLSEENRPAYRRIRDGISAWLEAKQIPHVTPEALPTSLYADASHPLTEGYELLAKRLSEDAGFKKWLRD